MYTVFYWGSVGSFLTCIFQAEAVQLIEDGKAPCIKQPEEGATYDPLIKKDKVEVSCDVREKD